MEKVRLFRAFTSLLSVIIATIINIIAVGCYNNVKLHCVFKSCGK